jgi:UDP-N-acetylglucosamine 4,6-dehydratase/5-epimerase
MLTHVLVGGTGTLGNALMAQLSRDPNNKIRVLARGEHRLNEMRSRYLDPKYSFIVCDVRERNRLLRAFKDADYVYHLAALKHVHTCEYDVIEAVKTNIDGSNNIVNACIDAEVKRAVLISTDKAVEPTTTYGATKLVAERIFTFANSYTGSSNSPIFYAVRYGNVLGSQGSVLTAWKNLAESKQSIGIVDPTMTRFWWSVQEAAKFVIRSMSIARCGDIIVPILSSCSLRQLAELVVPEAPINTIDGHDYEKQHELLVGMNEINNATYIDDKTIRIAAYLDRPQDEIPYTNVLASCNCINTNEVLKCLSVR